MATVLRDAPRSKSVVRPCRRCGEPTAGGPTARTCRYCEAVEHSELFLDVLATSGNGRLVETMRDLLRTLDANRDRFEVDDLDLGPAVVSAAGAAIRRHDAGRRRSAVAVRVVRDPRIPPLGDDDLDLPF